MPKNPFALSLSRGLPSSGKEGGFDKLRANRVRGSDQTQAAVPRASCRRVAVLRLRYAEMPAQRRSLIIGAEEAARLQDRDHLVDERFQLPRQRLEDNEAIGGAALEPFLQPVGHCLGRADESSARCRQPLGDLAQRQILGTHLLEDADRAALLAVEADMLDVREGRIEVILAEIMVTEGARQETQPRVDRLQRGELAIFRLGLLVGIANDRGQCRAGCGVGRRCGRSPWPAP